MENTYPNRCEEVLAHHGVLGMIKTADIAETVIEMEKLLDEKLAG